MKAPAAAVAVAVAATALAGCAPWLQRPFVGLSDGSVPAPDEVPREPAVACVGGPYPSAWLKSPGTVAIGPLSFRGLGLARPPLRFKPGSPPLTLPVFVPSGTSATISVPEDLRDVSGVDSATFPAGTPAEAHRAVRCSTGALGGAFTVSFVVAGPQCVPVSVDVGGRRWTERVRFGRPCS